MKQKLDAFLNNWVSKKLMVFVTATVLAFVGRLDGPEFVNVAVVYIGTQGAIDVIRQLRGVLKEKHKPAPEEQQI